jgi:hypothetical protein
LVSGTWPKDDRTVGREKFCGWQGKNFPCQANGRETAGKDERMVFISQSIAAGRGLKTRIIRGDPGARMAGGDSVNGEGLDIAAEGARRDREREQ